MRIGTFVLGGLVGAAAVIYLSDKKNRSMMFSAMTSPTDSLGKVLGKTKDRAFDAMLGGMNSGMPASNSVGAMSSAPAQSTSTGTLAGSAGKDGLAQVKKIVSQDPELKQTVNEILADSGKPSATLQ